MHLGPLDVAELEAKCRQDDLEGNAYRIARRLAAEHAAEIDRRFPKILRRVGGYNLDAFVPDAGIEDGRFNLARLLVGSEGTLGLAVEATLRLVELPRAKAMLVVEFADLLDALAATPADPARTGRRPSRSSTSTCSTAPSSTPRRPGSATSSRATRRRS